MKKILLLFFSLLIINSLTIAANDMKIKIIPQPQIVQITASEFYFPDEITIYLPGTDKEKDIYLKEYIESFLTKIPQYSESKSNANVILKLETDFFPGGAAYSSLGEAYSLIMKDSRFLITAKEYRGLFYGLVTLKKILADNSSTELREVEIIDYPDMQIRGISDDISRGQVSTLENFKKIIDFLAENKMNTYMPYIEDVLAFDKYPTIGKDRGALTKQEVKELVAYANSKFVDIIPVFQTLGHYENILSLDEFVHLAEFPGAASLDVSNPEIYDFLDGLLKEVTDIFPGEYLHVGADESFDVGWGNSKHLVDSSSIAEVHAVHYKKVYDLCKKYNRKMMMYGDIILRHPEILKLIPKDIIIVDWHYGARSFYSSTEIFKNAGFNYIVSPSVWNFLTTYPTNINALANIKYMVKSGLSFSSIGMINSNWGDYGAETFKELLYYGYAWSAQCAWSFDQSDIYEFTKEYFTEHFGIYNDNVKFCHTTLSNPLNQVLWHEIWRHPLLDLKKPVWWEPQVDVSAKLTWMEMTIPQLKESLSQLAQSVKQSEDEIEIWQYLANLYDWYILKLQTNLLLKDTTKTIAERKTKLTSLIKENIIRLESLKIDFRTIWNKHYKSDNLNMIEDKFERLVQYYMETMEQLKHDTLHSPLIESKWIYAINKKDDINYKEADFEFSFHITKPVAEAKLQLIGDNYAELYINDEYIDRVFTRRTLSLLVDYKRIKYLKITDKLKVGENNIHVVVKNFNPKWAAGFNIIARIKYDDGTIEKLMTNKEWKYKIPGHSELLTPVETDYRYEIIAPNFETDRTSWIER